MESYEYTVSNAMIVVRLLYTLTQVVDSQAWHSVLFEYWPARTERRVVHNCGRR
jgi:hypothetical protein